MLGLSVGLPTAGAFNLVAVLAVCPAGRQVGEVQMLVEAFKHYSKYASQALKVAMPKGGMRGDINPRHMQQVGRQSVRLNWGWHCVWGDSPPCTGLRHVQ